MRFRTLLILQAFFSWGFLSLVTSCENRDSTEVNSEMELKSIRRGYHELEDNKKVKAFNNIINYYQFTGSENALDFMRDKIKEKDPIAIDAVETAKLVGIKIPL